MAVFRNDLKPQNVCNPLFTDLARLKPCCLSSELWLHQYSRGRPELFPLDFGISKACKTLSLIRLSNSPMAPMICIKRRPPDVVSSMF